MLLCVALVDIRFIARLAWPFYFASLALLGLVLRMGHVGKGAQRWIEIGGTQLQPSELMKIALVVALAAWFHRATWERMGNPLFLIPPALAVAAPVLLILKEPKSRHRRDHGVGRGGGVPRGRRALVEDGAGRAAAAVRGPDRLRLPA